MPINIIKFQAPQSHFVLNIAEVNCCSRQLCIVEYDGGILKSSFFPKETLKLQMIHEYPNSTIIEKLTDTMLFIEKYLSGEIGIEIILWASGTEFQICVWNQLLQIPFGKTISYQKISEQINNPGAVRAVGAAVGSNEHAMLIPCHRVLYNNGSSGHFKWGPDLKKKILQSENPKLQFENSLFE